MLLHINLYYFAMLSHATMSSRCM